MLLRKMVVAMLLLIIICPMASEAFMGRQAGQMRHMGPMDRFQHGMGLRHGGGMYGFGFMHSAGIWLGEYVNFEIGADGSVINYSVGGFPVFDRFFFDDFLYEGNITTGAVTRLIGDGSAKIIQLHDNPSGNINLKTITAAKAIFDLSEGTTPKEISGGVLIESEDVTAYILCPYYPGTDVTYTLEPGKVIVDMPAGSAVVVRTGAVNLIGPGPFREDCLLANMMISDGITRGRFGCEIAIGNQSTYSSVNYTTGIRVWADQIERNRLRIPVASTNVTGTLVGINFDNQSFDIGDPDRLRVKLNDRLMNRTRDLNLLYNETGIPQCWWIAQNSSVQMICNIPSFSEQTITIESGVVSDVTPTPSPTPEEGVPGFETVFVIAGLLALAYLLRRNSRRAT